jgi:hypothetical protein
MDVLTAKGTDGQVTFDGTTLSITRGGFVGAFTKGGRGDMRLALSQITGVDLKTPGLTAGRFTVIAAGAVARGPGVRGHRTDMLTVIFQRWSVDEFTAIRDAVLARLANPGTSAGATVAGQLRQLAELHRAGALTDGEYTAAKARLLA